MKNTHAAKSKIGIVLPYLKSRGTEKQALRLAQGFVDRGAVVVLFVVQGWGLESMYQSFRDVGAQVVNVGPPISEGKKGVSIKRLLPLAYLLRKNGCTVLLSRAGMTNKLAGIAGRIARVPAVVVLSGSVKPRVIRSSFIFKQLRSINVAWSIGFPWKIISVSREGAKNFREAYGALANKVVAIPNGIDRPILKAEPPDFVGLDPQRFYYCFSGSLEIWRKGLDVLIEAILLIKREYRIDSLAVLLIGVGDDEQKLKHLVKSEAVEDSVFFAGEQSEPYDLMARCHCFILPSRKEGLPNALLEAMALGLCVVSADCDTGPREIITHEEDGLLVPPGDARGLAKAMVRVYRNEGLRLALANRAKRTVEEKFSYKKMVDEYFTLLRAAR